MSPDFVCYESFTSQAVLRQPPACLISMRYLDPLVCIIVAVNINYCTRLVVVDLLEQGKSRAISFSRRNAFSTRL